MTDYVALVAQAAGWDEETARKRMKKAKRDLEVTFSEYYKNEFWKKSTTEQSVASRKIVPARKRREAHYAHVEEACGQEKSQTIAEIKRINEWGIKKIRVAHYDRFEMYAKNDDELKAILELIAERDALCSDLRTLAKQVDAGTTPYEVMTEKLERFYDIERELLPQAVLDELIAVLVGPYPELKEDVHKQNEAAIDMDATRLILQMPKDEYLTYDFLHMPFEERLHYLSSKERRVILECVNDRGAAEVLFDKYQSYELLKKWYGRTIVQVASDQDFSIYKKFCKKHPVFVLKPNDESMGRGIKKVLAATENKAALKAQFEELVKENGRFCMEEIIEQHEAMAAFNPDSVNTIRLVTYNDNGSCVYLYPFIKVGRKGSFVDNSGSGGMFAGMDVETGIITTDAVDEFGYTYEKHPDSGVQFKGYQLPNWQGALDLVNEVFDKVPNIAFIGWDLAYTKEGNWVLVEGNPYSQLMGMQISKGGGLRQELIKLTHFEE